VKASWPSLTAVVPATNHPPTLDACTTAIAQAADPPEQTIVVDSPAGSGPSRARNAGAQAASGDVVVFVDADVVVHPDAFNRIRALFRADPELTAAFGSYDDDPLDRSAVSSFRNLLHHHVHQSAAGPADTFWAGLGAVRRDAFLAVGGFDGSRFPEPSIEDIDLGMRLSDAGARIVLDPRVLGRHLKSWSLPDMVRTDVRRRGIPWVVLLLSRRTAPVTLNLGWRHRLSAASVLGALGLALARRPGGAAVAGVAFVGLNSSLYLLLGRRRGPALGLLGVPLHAIHHLSGVAALPLGLLAYLRGNRRSGPGGEA
jgi:GT2 family glycosyltransferase